MAYESGDDIDHADADADAVPPPPPHIELLNLDCHGHCITHVISYLDVNSRMTAAVSCAYLRDAVNEAWLLERECKQLEVEVEALEEPLLEEGSRAVATSEHWLPRNPCREAVIP